jgi:hypothetical protein
MFLLVTFCYLLALSQSFTSNQMLQLQKMLAAKYPDDFCSTSGYSDTADTCSQAALDAHKSCQAVSIPMFGLSGLKACACEGSLTCDDNLTTRNLCNGCAKCMPIQSVFLDGVSTPYTVEICAEF